MILKVDTVIIYKTVDRKVPLLHYTKARTVALRQLQLDVATIRYVETIFVRLVSSVVVCVNRRLYSHTNNS